MGPSLRKRMFLTYSSLGSCFKLTLFLRSPHTLGAEELYNAHLTPYLEEAQAALNNKLEATAAENGELAQTVQAQRLEIERLLAHLESVVGDIEDAAKAATQFSEENHIREDALQMDEEVNAQPDI